MASLAEILNSKIGKGGKSKSYVASEMGVSEKTIENYMNGKRSPKPTALVKLSKLLDFSLSELSEQSVPQETNNAPKNGSVIKDRFKVAGHGALFSVLVSELASLKAHITGEHPEVIAKRIYKAAEDIERLGKF